ncbi:MAG: alternative ribosome rescue aminoacyl-tRNA hydrolase ArfB [Bacteroidia bacterium]|nr:alternative ribosome rescue aminoacyl-tRNA hydrolase ArfB [Bacteroidia bacterium]
MDISDRDFMNEFVFTASRSSGPGGQNVNKVSSKVDLRFNLWSSALLDEKEKAIIAEKLTNKINKEGELVLVAQTDRSQLKNKEKVIAKFYHLLEKALMPPKKRYKTKPTRASVEKRLESKRVKSTIKASRKDFEL